MLSFDSDTEIGLEPMHAVGRIEAKELLIWFLLALVPMPLLLVFFLFFSLSLS